MQFTSLGRLVLVPVVLAIPAAGFAQDESDRRRFERIQAGEDTTQWYALELPPGYSPGRRWPVLFLMDPRGRALIPLDCFSEAASRLGYVAMSSYNTRSDQPTDPNPAAVNAMLADALKSLSIDQSRLYLVGFSGTARAAWMMAAELSQSIAGIAGFGAGLPPQPEPLPSILRMASWPTRFSFAGGAGVLDFNYAEVAELADSLEARGIAHRIQGYPGAHAWPPASECSDALWWLHVRAMRTGLAALDSTLVREDRARRRAGADSLAARGALVEAAARYRSAAALYDGWTDAGEERRRAEQVETDPTYRLSRNSFAKLRRLELEWQRQGARALGRIREKSRTFDPKALFEKLDGPKLLAAARDSTDRLLAESAGRRLEWLFVAAAFYHPRSYLDRGKPALAAAFLALAEAIRPLAGEACRLAVTAHTDLGDSVTAGRYRSCSSAPPTPPSTLPRRLPPAPRP